MPLWPTAWVFTRRRGTLVLWTWRDVFSKAKSSVYVTRTLYVLRHLFAVVVLLFSRQIFHSAERQVVRLKGVLVASFPPYDTLEWRLFEMAKPSTFCKIIDKQFGQLAKKYVWPFVWLLASALALCLTPFAIFSWLGASFSSTTFSKTFFCLAIVYRTFSPLSVGHSKLP